MQRVFWHYRNDHSAESISVAAHAQQIDWEKVDALKLACGLRAALEKTARGGT